MVFDVHTHRLGQVALDIINGKTRGANHYHPEQTKVIILVYVNLKMESELMKEQRCVHSAGS